MVSRNSALKESLNAWESQEAALKNARQSAIKPDHGNSLNTTKPATGYQLIDNNTGQLMKYGETTRGTKRYSNIFYERYGVSMETMAYGSKVEMHYWQNIKILEYKAINNGNRPPWNLSDW